ncbi:hypothetical protein GCM10023084_01370 [Streptomyces lacrimifluminis]|uniref:Uncharacterized protein n=1 Tax=Streptomyces lacrimifluminis TaxID=1500077 RepID=A0A917KMG2_9ACTN|nr:DUF6243 family protein [Streptomyces lacrimifluminis]GGJ20763.1 hypothetical protein GCM10012282_16450 [Streptomyces lacrimifluminis]
MARGGGNMLGVGGTRSNLGKNALRGGGRGKQTGGGADPQAQKQELVRKLQEKRAKEQGAQENAPDGRTPDEAAPTAE